MLTKEQKIHFHLHVLIHKLLDFPKNEIPSYRTGPDTHTHTQKKLATQNSFGSFFVCILVGAVAFVFFVFLIFRGRVKIMAEPPNIQLRTERK